VADGLPGIHKAEILGLCDEVDILSRQLSDLCRRGHGDTPQAQDVARYISITHHKLIHSVCAFNI
jgi:vinculin